MTTRSRRQMNGYYKAEIAYGPTHPGPWKSLEEVELAARGGSTGTTAST